MPADLPPLFTPFSLRSVTFRNRLILSPMCQYVAVEGAAQPWHFDHHARFATGGLGGALVESTGVTRDGRITPGCLGAYSDDHLAGLSRIADIYHRHGAPCGVQLSHSGRKGSAAVPADGAQPLAVTQPDRAWKTVGPSAIAMMQGWPTPRALTATEIEQIIDAFASAAARVVKAGFDFVEIHGAHGYLLHNFVSPLSNRREDAWGGDIAGRSRLPLAVADAVRAVVPADMPVFYRASAVDGEEGGLELADTIELSRRLKAAGVDLIDVSSGGICGPSGRSFEKPHPGYLVPFSAEIRQSADIATMAVGLITGAQQANDIIKNGDADLVAMARQMIADPAFPFHAAQALGHPDPFVVLPAAYASSLRGRALNSRKT